MKPLKCAFITILFLGMIGITLNYKISEAEAQTNNMPKPPPPEFTIHLEAHPYYVPAEYEINPYTGLNRTLHSDYTVENKSLVFTIKNPPFTPYTDTEGNLIEVFYTIHAKGHFEDHWTDLEIVNSSNSEYTIKSYAIGENAKTEILGALDTGYVIDFQVRTQVGYLKINYVFLYPMGYSFIGETSDWSNIQTLTVGEFQTFTPSPESTPTPMPTSSPTPDNQQILNTEAIIGIAIIVVVLGAGIGLFIYLIKKN